MLGEDLGRMCQAWSEVQVSERNRKPQMCVWGCALLEARRLSAVNAAFGAAVPGEGPRWGWGWVFHSRALGRCPLSLPFIPAIYPCCLSLPFIPAIHSCHLDHSHSRVNFSRLTFDSLKSSPSSPRWISFFCLQLSGVCFPV